MRSLAPAQKVSLFVNEKPVGHAGRRGDEQALRRQRSGGAAAPGDNRLRMTFKSAADIAGGKRAAAAVTRWRSRPAALGPPAGDLAPARRARGRPRRRAPARRWSRAAPPRGCRSTCSCPRGRTAGGRPTARRRPAARSVCASRSTARPRARSRGQRRRGLDRGARRPRRRRRPRAARIDLVARGTKGDLAWADPRIVVKAPAPAAARRRRRSSSTSSSGWSTPCAPTSCRAYNPKSRVTTPNYDAFAADATRFAWAQVPGTWSLPSHASILTGVYPTVHQATAHEAKLSQERRRSSPRS